MTIKDVSIISKSFKFLIDNLNIRSSVSRNIFLMQKFNTDKLIINKELNDIEFILSKIKKDKSTINQISLKFLKLRDIKGSILNLSEKRVLDDIELFEIKSFAILSNEINTLCKDANINIFKIPSLKEVIEILDPDGTNIPMFYIYDSYSEELANLRKKIKIATKKQDKNLEEELRYKADEFEDNIRVNLSNNLNKYVDDIKISFDSIINLDITIAKANQAYELNLCKPTISDNNNEISKYQQMFNPLIAHNLQKNAQKFQSIDITLNNSPCVITGANMSGKTVILKTIELIQYLTQFGMYIPAKSAHIVLVDQILVCMDDEQDELKGLSSFAAEILSINNIIKTAKESNKILVLIDELARTTNPIEGNKIVSATIQMLKKYNIRSLITTHYSNINTDVRRLRVKGLASSIKNVTIDNINSFIDYSLIETTETEVPKEAIRIAEILNVDREFLELMNS